MKRGLLAFVRRLAGSFGGRRAEREFREELESHVQMHVEDNIRAGMGPDEARRRAVLALGGIEPTRELYRERQGLPLFEIVSQDVRLGWRMMRRSPAFTTVALVVLALGIGANTLMFGVVNALLLRPLPYPDADHLLLVQTVSSANDAPGATAVPDFHEYRSRNRTLQGLASFYTRPADVTGVGEPERVRALIVSSDFLGVLQTPPTLGRDLTRRDETWGEHRVVLLTDGFWQRRFGGEAGVVGQHITLNAEPHTVVGILPRRFSFVGVDAQLVIPMAFAPGDNLNSHNNYFLTMVGRRRTKATSDEALADLNGISEAIIALHSENQGTRIGVKNLQDAVVGDVKPALVVLSGAVGLVLLITCANLATLVLARSARRRRELALRMAIGASRRRVLSQLLTESVLLAVAGSLLGVVLGAFGVTLINSLSQTILPRTEDVRIDGVVLAFTGVVAVVTGILAGLMPALRRSREEPGTALKEGGRSLGDPRGRRIRAILVAAEVAVCLILLIGAGLLLQSLRSLTRVDAGFTASNVLTLQISVPKQRYVDEELERRFSPLAYTKATAFFTEVVREARAVSGVSAAGAINALPLMGEVWGKNATLYDRPFPATVRDLPSIQYRVVAGDYFRVLEVPIVRGRAFADSDTEGSAKVAIINEEMARLYWNDRDPVGNVLSVNPPRHLVPAGTVPADYAPTLYTIVGVAGDVRYGDLKNPARALVYTPYSQGAEGTTTMYLALRTAADPTAVVPAIRERMGRLDPNIPLSGVQTMEARVASSMGRPRLQAVVLGAFAGLALVLSIVGVYGVMMQSTQERTREIGIRMAVGADASDVVALFLRQGVGVVALGLVAGLVGAFGLTQALRSLLYAVSPTDPSVFAAVTAALGVTGGFAAWLPARLATRLDPLVVLREE